MKATIKLSESEVKGVICEWLLREYGISVNATNDIAIEDYYEECHGDPHDAPVRAETRHGAEISVSTAQLKKK